MLRFLVEFVVFAAVLATAALPLGWVGRRAGRSSLQGRWFKRAIIVALVAAVLSWSSRDLTGKCEAASNRACFDIGGTGVIVLLVGGFVLWALISAWLLYHD